MKRIAEFEKISAKQFALDYPGIFPGAAPEEIRGIYEALQIPVRATAGSAGYDFRSTAEVTLAPGESVRIPTGLRCRMAEGWVLMIFPRSGLGFTYRLQLDNTVGIIDSDYYGAANEGHIFIKVTNDSREGKSLALKKGDAFAQGVFLPFGITQSDAASGIRSGGLGSTSA